jgi:hypothetical protein
VVAAVLSGGNGAGTVAGDRVEAAAVGLREDSGIAPALTGSVADLLRHRTEVKDVDDEQIARLGTLDVERPGQHVRMRQVDISDVVCGVVVADLPVGPFPAFDPNLLSWTDIGRWRDVGVPPVVTGHGLVAHRVCLINGEDDVGHGNLQFQGRGRRACRGSDVIGVARRERPGADETTCGASALRSPASCALRRPASSARNAGDPNTLLAVRPQPGQTALAPVGRTTSKPPHWQQENA